MKRRVVVTGMGTVNPIGNSVKETWQAAVKGICGIAPIQGYDTTGRKVALAGEVKNFDFSCAIEKKDMRKMDRYTMLAMAAAKEAMEDSGLPYETADTSRWGCDISSGIGGISTIAEEEDRGREKGFDRVSAFFIPRSIANMAAGQVAIRYHLHGMCTCVTAACAGGTNAIGDSFRLVRDGYEDVAVCGGSEAAVTALSVGGFTSMRALCTRTDIERASIPFDKERSGFVMGEGAGILVLEELEHALARNAHIYGEISGYGVSCDAYHITAPSPDGEGAASCIRDAIRDAGIVPGQVGYLNAHGTSTTLNDKCETAAVKKVFGDDAKNLLVSSTKAMTGHLLGAAGALEAVLTVSALYHQVLPANIHYKVPDPECDLNIITKEAVAQKTDYALSDSLGFGGHNAALVFHWFEG